MYKMYSRPNICGVKKNFRTPPDFVGPLPTFLGSIQSLFEKVLTELLTQTVSLYMYPYMYSN